MEIKVITEEDTVCYEWETLEIEVDGQEVFSACTGEHEDNTLTRNFSDCYKVASLMKMAFEAGKRGEELTIIEIDKNEEK